MPHNQAASIVAMRNVIEEMTIKAANDPEIIVTQPEEYGRLCSTIRSLCRSNAGRYTGAPAAAPTNSSRGYVSFLVWNFLLIFPFNFSTKPATVLFFEGVVVQSNHPYKVEPSTQRAYNYL